MENTESAKSRKKTKSTPNREEIRGLFVVGVITTLLAAKEYWYNVPFKFGPITVNGQLFINIILVMWGGYIFCMVFSSSDDFLSENLRNLFSILGINLLMAGTVLFIYIVGTIFIMGNFSNINFLIYPIAPFIILFIYKKYKNLPKIEKNEMKITIESLYKIEYLVTLCFFVILYGLSLSSLNSTAINTETGNKLITNSLFATLFAICWVILHVFQERTIGIKMKKK